MESGENEKTEVPIMEPKWVVFYGPDGTELLRISLDGLAEGEIPATISLLAYERGISESSISFAVVGGQKTSELEGA